MKKATQCSRAKGFRGELIVVQRDGELLFRLSEDFGKTWTDFEELKLLFPGYIIGMGNDQIQKMGELELKKTIDDEIFENEAKEIFRGSEEHKESVRTSILKRKGIIKGGV